MRSPRGQALVLGYLTILVLTVLGNTLLTSSLTSSRLAQIAQLQEDVFYLAEGGLEDAAARFAQAIADFEVSPAVSFYPDPDGDGASGSAEVVTTTFTSTGATAASTITETLPPAELVMPDPDGTPVFVKRYHIRTTVVHPDNPSVMKVMNQVVSRRLIATFRHAVFYNGDLEWLPGPNMTMTGRIHTNHDLYIGTHNLLTVDSEYVRAAGALYNRRKDDLTNPPAGTVKIKNLETDLLEAVDGLDSEDADWATASQDRWGGTVQTGVHGVKKLAVPAVGSIAPDGFYAAKAAIKIVNTDVFDNVTGTAIPQGVPGGLPPNTVQTKTIYDQREGKYVQLVDVSLKRLAGVYDCDNDGDDDLPGTGCNSAASHLPSNGLLYVTGTVADPTQMPGVRLKYGSRVRTTATGGNPNAGLTVVTNDPLYVQGDFNLYSKKPVALIADAMNILSENWSDSNGNELGDPFSNRTAGTTTINAAMVAGIVPTPSSPGPYSGGLENYPRLHESWTGKELRITGSFVSLWDSQIAVGQWHYGSPNYTAPVRAWAYDPSLNGAAGLPPFTPMAVEMTDEAWWEE
jgi:hypothetical protein